MVVERAKPGARINRPDEGFSRAALPVKAMAQTPALLARELN
jgi:hypothetical protein